MVLIALEIFSALRSLVAGVKRQGPTCFVQTDFQGGGLFVLEPIHLGQLLDEQVVRHIA